MPKPDLGDQPAFPVPPDAVVSTGDWRDGTSVMPARPGMTLRQHYVGQALSGIIASYSGMAVRESVELVSKVGGPEAFADCVAKAAVIYANAAIRALETPP